MKDDLAETLPQQVQSVFAASNPPVVVSMRLQGRGSPQDATTQNNTSACTNSSIMMGGILLEPLHVLIEASSQDVLSRAEALVDDLVQRAEEATVHPDLLVDSGNNNTTNTTTSESSQSRALVSSSIALATIQDPQSSKGVARTTAYRPASVAQLIGQVNAAESTGQPTTPSGEWVEEELQVPVGVVGLIIGKGGEQIAQLQARTGARVQVQREPTNTSSTTPAATHRTVSIAAATQAALDHCKQLILAIVEEKSKTLMTGTAGMNRKDAQRLQDAVAAGHVHVTLAVPSDSVGLVIGKGGATIRSLQEQTGAHIQVPSASEAQDGQRTLHITHPQRAGAEQAQRLIQDLVQQHTAAQTHHHKGVSGGGVYGSSSTNPAPAVNPVTATDPQVTATMLIPDADVGLIIGRQGVVIRYLQDSTGAQIQIPPECHYPGSHERLATLTGTATACRQAQAKLGQIIADQSSAGVMAQASPSAGGGAGAGHYGNYYSYPGTAAAGAAGSKPDGYSAEWAAYHAAQQAAAAAAAAAPPTTTTTAPYYGGASSTASYPSYGYPQQQAQQPQQQPYAPLQQQQGGGGAPTTSSTTNPTNTTATTTAAPSGPAATAGTSAPATATTPGTTTTTPTVSAGATQPAVSVATATTTTATTTNSTTPASDAYYEQFFRYAYYYGEPAARQYYGPHWSPPVGTANPYGVNPNLPATATITTPAATGTAHPATTTTTTTTPAPTAPMTTTTTTATSSSGPITTATPAASQPPPQQRETSVRKVSNLPAWMNKGT